MRLYRKLITNMISAVFMAGSLPLYADSKSGLQAGKDFSFSAYLLQLGLSLILIVVLLFVIFWYMRRFSGAGPKNNRFIKVLSTLPLSTRDKLVVMRVHNQYMLLGISPGNMQVLHKFDMDPQQPIEEPEPPQFFKQFMNAMSPEKKS